MSKQPRTEIVRSTAGWRVRVIAGNGEQLSVSEVLSSRPKAFTNLYAQQGAFSALYWKDIRVQFIDERPPRAKKARKA